MKRSSSGSKPGIRKSLKSTIRIKERASILDKQKNKIKNTSFQKSMRNLTSKYNGTSYDLGTRRYKINSILGKKFNSRSKSGPKQTNVSAATNDSQRYKSFRYIKENSRNLKSGPLTDRVKSKKASSGS
jgi:hypothetical protein